MSIQNSNILEESDPFYETNSMFVNQDKWKLFDAHELGISELNRSESKELNSIGFALINRMNSRSFLKNDENDGSCGLIRSPEMRNISNFYTLNSNSNIIPFPNHNEEIESEKQVNDFHLSTFWGKKNKINDDLNEKKNGKEINTKMEVEIEEKERNEIELNESFNPNSNSVGICFSSNKGAKSRKKGLLQFRSMRGLRFLSLKVKDIVCKKNKSTYKEVAECLVKELKLNPIKTLEESKDEQNVKRRVYDALNVLISANILKRNGKNVISDQNSKLSGQSLIKYRKEKKIEYEKMILAKKESIQQNKLKLSEIKNKTNCLKNLIDRNMKNENRENNDANSIHFPFLALQTKNSKDFIKIELAKERNNLFLSSSNEINIYGDLDICLKLGFHLQNHD